MTPYARTALDQLATYGTACVHPDGGCFYGCEEMT